jgi:hypothetical protein
MKITKFYFILILAFIWLGCNEKENFDSSDPYDYAYAEIDSLVDFGDSVKVYWRPNGPEFISEYQIYRYDYLNIKDTMVYSTKNVSDNPFTDKHVPYVHDLYYDVCAVMKNGLTKKRERRDLDRRNVIIFNNVTDKALIDTLTGKLFVQINDDMLGGELRKIDCKKFIIEDSVQIFPRTDYWTFGEINSEKVILVPSDRYFFEIFGASNFLKYKEVIQCDLMDIDDFLSIINRQGWVYYIASRNPIKAMKLGENGTRKSFGSDNYETLAVFPDAGNDLLALSELCESGSCTTSYEIWGFDAQQNERRIANGQLSEKDLNLKILEMAPSGQQLVLGDKGLVLNRNMRVLGKLPTESEGYTSFAYNGNSTRLYAGVKSKNEIIEFDAANLKELRRITTLYSPDKIFVCQNMIINIGRPIFSKIYAWEVSPYSAIEKIKL